MSLGSIPNDVRVPLVYIDIDNSEANSGTPALAQKVLVLGQQLATGTADALTLNRITTSESQMDDRSTRTCRPTKRHGLSNSQRHRITQTSLGNPGTA